MARPFRFAWKRSPRIAGLCVSCQSDTTIIEVPTQVNQGTSGFRQVIWVVSISSQHRLLVKTLWREGRRSKIHHHHIYVGQWGQRMMT
jgi:hypothetical protein